MALKSLSEITHNLINSIHDTLPDIDTKEGTFIRDVFINPTAAKVSELYDEIRYMQISQSILTASGEDLDKLSDNYFVERKQATKSYGTVRFFLKAPVTKEIIIPKGTTISTIASTTIPEKVFETTETRVIPIGHNISDPNKPRLVYVDVAVASTFTGTSANVNAMDIKKIQGVLDANVVSVENSLPFTGGTDIESDLSLALRVSLAISGSNIGTKDGYTAFILKQEEVIDARVVGGGEPLMKRDEGKGGMVDIYVRALRSEEDTYKFFVDRDYVIDKADSAAFSNILIPKQPVTKILSIKGTPSGSTFQKEYINGSDYKIENISNKFFLDKLWPFKLPVGNGDVVGELAIVVDGDDESRITLNSGDSFDNIISKINTATIAQIAFKSGNRLKLMSQVSGDLSSIEILSASSNILLGQLGLVVGKYSGVSETSGSIISSLSLDAAISSDVGTINFAIDGIVDSSIEVFTGDNLDSIINKLNIAAGSNVAFKDDNRLKIKSILNGTASYVNIKPTSTAQTLNYLHLTSGQKNGTGSTTSAKITSSVDIVTATETHVGALVLTIDDGQNANIDIDAGDTIDSIILKINASVGQNVTTKVGSKLVITSPTTGTTSSIEIKNTSTASSLVYLGLSVNRYIGSIGAQAEVLSTQRLDTVGAGDTGNLVYEIDGVQKTVSLVVNDNIDTIVTKINTGFGASIASNENNKLKITSPTFGKESSVEIKVITNSNVLNYLNLDTTPHIGSDSVSGAIIGNSEVKTILSEPEEAERILNASLKRVMDTNNYLKNIKANLNWSQIVPENDSALPVDDDFLRGFEPDDNSVYQIKSKPHVSNPKVGGRYYIKRDGALYERTYYTPDFVLEKDTSFYGHSYTAKDAIKWIDNGINKPSEGETLDINYSYSGVINDLQKRIDEKRVLTADVLVIQARRVGIEVYVEVLPYSNYSEEDVKNSIINRITSYINNIQKLGGIVSTSDIAFIVRGTDGVDDVGLDTLKLARTDETPSKQIIANDFEFLEVDRATVFVHPIGTTI